MDNLDTTIQTYREGFDTYRERTVSEVSGDLKEWMDAFAELLPKKGTILELGSATGRDARYFASKGFTVVCTDVIPQALEALAEEGFETAEYDFRNEPRKDWIHRFDGFFANAVLLHAPQDVFLRAINTIAKVLVPGGVAAFSLKNGAGDEVTDAKMDAPRYFNYHNEQEMRDILSESPFDIVTLTHSEGDKWLLVTLKLCGEKDSTRTTEDRQAV